MPSTRGRQVVIPLTNRSGGSVAAGDVVVIDAANDAAFTTTTTGRAEVSIGIAQETIASLASGRVLTHGYAGLVNVPASVTRGHYIETHTVVKQATGSATRRSGSTGQFLTGGTTPTAWLWGQTDQTASGGGGSGALTLLQTQTASASASLSYTTTITSTYDEYLIEFVGIVPATNSVAFWMRMSTDGGATYDSGANYGWAAFTMRAGASATTGAESAATKIQVGFSTDMVNTATKGLNGSIRLYDPASTARHKYIMGHVTNMDASGFNLLSATQGIYISTTAVNAFQFLMSSGNISSGIIRTYGIAKT